MIRIIKFILSIYILITFTSLSLGKESFFEQALKMYKEKKI